MTTITLRMHVNYPHHVGALYDCPACEGRCFCEELNQGMVGYAHPPLQCVHCAIVEEESRDPEDGIGEEI